jgi:predicted flap endonuclease-1-like 5' DNA nuclease
MSCALGSWALAAGIGVLTVVLLLLIGGTTVMAALFLGGLAIILLGLVFGWLFCAPLPKPGETAASAGRKTLQAVPPGADPSMPKPGPSRVSGDASPGGTGSGSTAGASASADTKRAKAAEAASGATTARSAGAGGDLNAASDTASVADVRPDVNSATANADSEAGAQVKPSATLPGQEELASRKGRWKYESGASQAQATPEAQADTVEGPGTRPVSLDAPREGGADDLTRIKGIGPKLEALCHELGFYHFDQVAAWTADEVAWVDQNLEGFKGRVTRDNWVEQARVLAEGGETGASG